MLEKASARGIELLSVFYDLSPRESDIGSEECEFSTSVSPSYQLGCRKSAGPGTRAIWTASLRRVYLFCWIFGDFMGGPGKIRWEEATVDVFHSRWNESNGLHLSSCQSCKPLATGQAADLKSKEELVNVSVPSVILLLLEQASAVLSFFKTRCTLCAFQIMWTSVCMETSIKWVWRDYFWYRGLHVCQSLSLRPAGARSYELENDMFPTNESKVWLSYMARCWSQWYRNTWVL